MKATSLFIPLSCLLLLSVACRPEPQVPDPYCADRGCPVYDIPEDFRAWFMVPQEGATYLMQDSLTGRTERLRVVNRIDNYQPRVNHEAESSMAEYRGDSIDVFQLQVGLSPRMVKLDMRATILLSSISQVWRDSGSTVIQPAQYIKILDSVEVLGNTYHDVLTYRDDGYYLQETWFAKGVGLIRLDYRGGYTQTVFLLESYQPK